MARNTTGWKLSGTTSFRKASAQLLKGRGPGEKGFGCNLQNPSPDVLRIHVPDPGKIFVQVDQAGAEALIVAYLAPAGKFRSLFLNGIKSHVYVATKIFQNSWIVEGHPADFFLSIPISELKQQPQWKPYVKYIKDTDEKNHRYFVGKKSCHSFNYRMGPGTFQGDVLRESEGAVALSRKQCNEFHASYHTLFPEIRDGWWKEIDEIACTTRTLTNLFGYPRRFQCNDKPDDKMLKEMTSWVPQSTVGCITNIAQVELQTIIEDTPSLYKDVDVLNNKHDSLLCQCDIGHEREVAALMRLYIEKPLINFRGEHFQMKSEAAVGMNWGKYNPTTNPQGLKEIEY